jgi:hypothetical protein
MKETNKLKGSKLMLKMIYAYQATSKQMLFVNDSFYNILEVEHYNNGEDRTEITYYPNRKINFSRYANLLVWEPTYEDA